MSDNSDLKPPSLSKDREETIESIGSSLIFFEDEIDKDAVLLRDTDSRNLYLTKVGLVFCLYYLILCLNFAIVYLHKEEVRRKYFAFHIFDDMWTYGLGLIFIKVIFSLFGRFIRSFSKLFFLIDIVLINVFAMGLFFYLNGYLQTMYQADGYIVPVSCLVLFASSVGLVVSAMVKDNKRLYNYWAGLFFTNLFSIATLMGIFHSGLFENFSMFNMYLILASTVAYNIYIVLNSFQTITFRVEKFYDNEHIYCFFCFWTDLILHTWIDIFRSSKYHRLQQKKLRMKQEAERANVEAGIKSRKRDIEANRHDESF